ncbi:hypothetical protein DSECCO2_408060 [anaerobic digester metagenome]
MYRGADGPDFLVGVVQGVGGQDAAVEVGDVRAGGGVDVGDVGFLLRRREGRGRRVEEGVLASEDVVQTPQGQDQGRGPDQGVDALGRGRGVALPAQDRKLEPQDALFGHLDGRAVLCPEVRDKDQIVLGKDFGPLAQDVLDAQGVARLLVGGQQDAQGQAGLRLGLFQGAQKQEGADHALMVVLDAAAVDEVAVAAQDEGVRLPQGQVAGGDHVGVGDEPQGARAPAGAPHREARPDAALDPGIRGVDALHRDVLETGQVVGQPCRLGRLPLAAVGGAEGGDGHQGGLEPDELVAAAVDDVENGAEHGCAPCWSPGGLARNFEEKKGRMILPCA